MAGFSNMGEKEEEFYMKLLSMFAVEAREHVSAMSTGLVELETAEASKGTEILERIYREAHSLKSAARAVDLADISTLCQILEALFDSLKRGVLTARVELFDTFHRTMDVITGLIPGDAGAPSSGIRDMVGELEAFLRPVQTGEEGEGFLGRQTGGGAPIPEKVLPEEFGAEKKETIAAHQGNGPVQQPMMAGSDTVRVSAARLDALLLQTEEFLSVKLATMQRLLELREFRAIFNEWRKEREGGGPTAAAQSGTIVDNKLTALVKLAEYDARSFSVMVDNLLEDMKKTLMLPFSSLTALFPRLVRDLSRTTGKEIQLVVKGGEIEADRRVLEGLKDALIHLVRNCIDHGIEGPDERKLKHKPPAGTVTLAVTSKGSGKIEIRVSDDGAGIDIDAVKADAVRRGIITKDEAETLTEEEAISLIFRSSVTTSRTITDISGRGIGLAIVSEKVGGLNGMVDVATEPDKGTSFLITVPSAFSTFKGVLVVVDGRTFVVPVSSVEAVYRVDRMEIKTVENRDTVLIGGKVVSVVRLADVLGLGSPSVDNSPSPVSDPYCQIVVLGSGEKRMAFVVDEVLQEKEVLVKPLGRQLVRVPNVAGATISGNGAVLIVLHAGDLVLSATRLTGSMKSSATGEVERGGKAILVVEDSITSRALLQNILSSAGYRVSTAVDGVDAFTALKTQKFDLVVSDVQMPRMDGFGLTAKIRGEKELTDLPVVLVTALESRADRERGIDVGASAYLVKSGFDQENLLEVVRRLI